MIQVCREIFHTKDRPDHSSYIYLYMQWTKTYAAGDEECSYWDQQVPTFLSVL